MFKTAEECPFIDYRVVLNEQGDADTSGIVVLDKIELKGF
jgi:hypothetical protein